jgi:hypothetical protein
MKTRKLTALMLALALLAFPVLSMAETAPSSFLDEAYESGRSVTTTITFLPGDEMTRDPSLQLFGDLLNVLRMETTSQKQGGTALEKFELFLQDKSSLSLTTLKDNNEFHIMSNLLGEQVLSFTPEEYMAMYFNLMEANLTASGATEEEIAFLKAYQRVYTSMMKGKFPDLSKFDGKSLQEDLILPMSAWGSGLFASPEVTTGVFESDKYDTATTKAVYSLTAEKIADFLDIITGWATRDQNLDQLLAMVSTIFPEYGDLTPYKEDVKKAYQGLPESFRKEIAPAFLQPITLTVFLDKDGLSKAMELNARFAGSEPDDPDVLITAGQYEKTGADGVTDLYSLDIVPSKAGIASPMAKYGFDLPGADSVSISLSVKAAAPQRSGENTVAAEKWRFLTVIKGSGVELFVLRLNYEGQTVSSAKAIQKDWTLNVYVSPEGRAAGATFTGSEKSTLEGEDAKAEGKVDVYYMGAKPALTIAYTTQTGEPEELVIPKDGVHLGKMTLEELEAWGQEAAPVVMGQFMGLISNLPPSILKVIYGSPAEE